MSCEEVELLNDLLSQDKDLTAILSVVNKNLKELKGKLQHELIQEKHFSLKSFQYENESLMRKVDALNAYLTEVEESNAELIKSINHCSTEITSLSASLQDINLTANALTWLLDLHENLSNAQEKMKRKKFFESSEIISVVLSISKNSEELQNLEMLKNLKQEAVLLRERILFEVSELWSLCVDFKTEKKTSNCLVSILIDRREEISLRDAIKSSFYLSDSIIERRFFTKLKEHVLLPIIFHHSEIIVNSKDDHVELVVKIDSTQKNPNYLDVFKGIITVMEFTKTYLNVLLADGTDLMSKMGQSMAQEVTSTLMKHCLTEAIPSEPGQLKAYAEIVSNAEKLQASLQTFGFLPSGYSPFMDHAQDVNLLFANKIYLSYLDRAKDLMKKDLHTLTSCVDISLPKRQLFPPKILNAIIETLNLKDEKQLFMTKCQISKSAQDLLNLVIAIEKEMEASDDNRSIRLLYTVRNIFEMYTAIVPLHHKKMLDTLPQQIAIFHNNCLHFAFRLFIFASECRQKNLLRDHCHVLLDQAIALRQLGVRSLENAVSNQRSQLIYILRDSGLGTLFESAKLDPGTEKAIRQCIRQLQLIRNVWLDILPDNVFNNAMGFLVDAYTEEVVSLVLTAEDISSQTSTELVNMFKIAQERLPSLFKDPREVHRLCKKWGRFSELIFVLDGNLGSISSRWAEGAGPLACEFTADQIKHLVRALFQNTEQRAALLTRIK